MQRIEALEGARTDNVEAHESGERVFSVHTAYYNSRNASASENVRGKLSSELHQGTPKAVQQTDHHSRLG